MQLRRSDIFRKIVPYLRIGHRENPVTDCRQIERWHHQTVSTSRAEGLSIRKIGDTNDRPDVPWYAAVQNFVGQYGDLIDDALCDVQPMHANERISNIIEAP